jgi:hypothetical protein
MVSSSTVPYVIEVPEYHTGKDKSNIAMEDHRANVLVICT